MREKTLAHWDFSYIPNHIIPALHSAGVGDADIAAMTVSNVRRLWAG